MKHDEAKDVRLLSKVCKINPATKSITINRNQIIGNKRWGRLDFLCHYCGYHIVYNDGAVVTMVKPDDSDNREKKEKKRPNKMKK